MNYSRRKHYILLSISIITAFLFTGCSRQNTSSIFDPTTGRHIDGWQSIHGTSYLAQPDSCTTCHGADLKGGISGVSCATASYGGITCHAGGPGHQTGWNDPASHGMAAKSAPSTTSKSGFGVCQICHGSDYAGGLMNKSCFTCHGVSAPHPPKPWYLPSSSYTHTNTDPANAAICAGCHTSGTNSDLKPTTAAAAGSSPDCFNNTLCHGAMGHQTGWLDPAQHGTAAKSAPTTTATTGFDSCQHCHGSNFDGGFASISCFTCHGVSAPHPAKPWSLPISSYTHTNTDSANAAVCAQCHTGGTNSDLQPVAPAASGTAPDCFNGTLCHGSIGHASGWNAPSLHGVAAKSAASASAPSGFSVCQKCHGSDFSGGAVYQSCFTCHGVSAPHPPKPWYLPGSAYTHTTTDTSNASVCAGCHTNGLNSDLKPTTPAAAGTTPSCFNNTLCHGEMSCTSCHGWPPSGSAAPNRAGSHSGHYGSSVVLPDDCNTCHNGYSYNNGVVELSFPSTYNAKSGSAIHNSDGTCSKIICHGGQTTPAWYSGTSIDVNTQCTSCHKSGTTEYNSYHSGQHTKHVSQEGIACTKCHDTTKLATVHFQDLNTTGMTNAYKTLNASLNYTGSASATGSCTPSCHDRQTW